MKLNELSPADGSKKSRQRVGRGVGSGWGKTAGRGSKGQGARSGGGGNGNARGGGLGNRFALANHLQIVKRLAAIGQQGSNGFARVQDTSATNGYD